MEVVDRVKRAELLASVGAGVLGTGLGATFPILLGRVAVPIIVLGASMHAVGMWQRHRIDVIAGSPHPRWSMILFWGCWLALLLLAAYLVVVPG